MPKMPDLVFVERNEIGEKFSESMKCSVDTKTGTFKAVIPMEVYEVIDSARREFSDLISAGTEWKSRTSPDCGQIAYATSSQLEHLKSGITKAIKLLLETTVVEEIVIKYAMSSSCHYWQTPDGAIFPNGGDGRIPRDEHGRTSGNWSRDADRHQMDLKPYRVGLFVQLQTKQTHTNRAGGVTVKYARVSKTTGYAALLQGFPHMGEPKFKEISEMPYTEEAAEFFYNMLMGLCGLSQRMFAFFEDKERITQAIENRSSFFALPRGES